VSENPIFLLKYRELSCNSLRTFNKVIAKWSMIGISPHMGRLGERRKDCSMTLTKAHIVENLFAKNIFTKTESAQVIETLFEIVKQTLERGEDVLISGFGKFSVKDKNQRRGRNPQTGDPIILSPRKVVTFKCSGVLRDRINQGK